MQFTLKRQHYLYEDTHAHNTSATLGQVLLSKHSSVKNLLTFI